MVSVKKDISKIDLTNPEFSVAQSLLEDTNQSIFLTGKAGTGKSTFLRHLTAKTKKKYVVLAPTGIAAVNVGGQTMHSFFKIPLKPLLPDDPDFAVPRLRGRLKYSKSHIKLIKSLELIIIDEISMVRADIMDFVDRVLRVYSGNMRQPFGGKQLLLVGDIFQLEPVVTGNDRDILSRAYSSFFFFNANVFKEMEIVPIELTKVYRQDEQRFVTLLDTIRTGLATQTDINLINSRYHPNSAVSKGSKDFTITIATRREMVDAINERHLENLPTPSVTFEGVIENDFPLNALPTDLNLELKVGAQVVFVKNDSDKRWVNGTIGVVSKCLPGDITVKLEDGEEHDVEIERWSNVKYVFNEKTRKVDEIELGAFMQYPLKPAWALTIHKSQGLTFNNVIIDIGKGAFAAGQTYVALSRCRSLEGITLLNPISNRDIYVRPEVIKFAAKFNNSNLIESAIEKSRADTLFKSAADAFNSRNYGRAFELYSEALSLRPEVGRMPNVKRLLHIKALEFHKLNQTIVSLNNRLKDDAARFKELADRYVKTADELSGEGWEAEAAIAQYNKALELSPDYPPAILGKARIYERLGQFNDAHDMYVMLLSVDKDNAWKGYIGLGDIAQSEDDDFIAISNYLNAHDKAPEQSEPLKRLVELYERLLDFDSANIYKRKLERLLSKRNRKTGR